MHAYANRKEKANLLIANLLLQQQPTPIRLERKAHEAVLAARVVHIILDRLCGSAAGEIQSTVVGGFDVELDVVVILAFWLATEELADLPDVVAGGGDVGGLAGGERRGGGEAGGGEEGEGCELHFVVV